MESERPRRTRTRARWRAIVLAMMTSATLAAAGGDGKPDTGVAWTELRYEARKLGLKATATIRVEAVPPSALADHLATVEGGAAALAPGGPVVRVEVESHLPFGRDEVTTSWVEVGSGRGLQAEKLVTGRKFYWKRKRFTAAGHHLWRAEAASKAEEELGHADWTSRSEYDEPYEPSPAGRTVADPWSLFYALAAADLGGEGARAQLVVPSDEALVAMEMVSHGLEQKRIRFTERRAGRTTTHDGATVVRRVRGSGRLLDGEATDAEVETGLLGIQGDLEMLVLEDGTPVEISGRSKGIGQLVVRLVHRELR